MLQRFIVQTNKFKAWQLPHLLKLKNVWLIFFEVNILVVKHQYFPDLYFKHRSLLSFTGISYQPQLLCAYHFIIFSNTDY